MQNPELLELYRIECYEHILVFKNQQFLRQIHFYLIIMFLFVVRFDVGHLTQLAYCNYIIVDTRTYSTSLHMYVSHHTHILA